jgi:hypothetical protein
LKVQKSGLDVPPEFLVALDAVTSGGTTMASYIRDANEVYRGADEEKDLPVVPGKGVPSHTRRVLRRAIAGKEKLVRTVRVRWTRLPKDKVFEIDREAMELKLNTQYRAAMVDGTGSDASLSKVLLFLLLRAEFDRLRVREKQQQLLRDFNLALVTVLTEDAH